MVSRLDKDNRFGAKISRFCAGAIFVLLLLFMLYLLPSSLTRTSSMSTGADGGAELLIFKYDNLFFNLIALTITVSIVYLCDKLLEQVKLNIMLWFLVIWTTVVGVIFVLSAKLSPGTSTDSAVLVNFAKYASWGDFSYTLEYYKCFPFQLGFTFYIELVFRLLHFLFPSIPDGYVVMIMQGINVLCLAGAYYAIVRSVGLICNNKNDRAQKITVILLFWCLPPILFTTFVYGTITSFSMACFATWMFLKFLREKKWYCGLLCGVFMAVAVVLKLNTLIFFIALIIIWIISLIRNFDIKSLAFLIITAVMVIGLKGMPQKYYEVRMGTDFGEGVPQSSWLAMGLNEGYTCSGWYNPTYTRKAFWDSDFDREYTSALAKEAIKERVNFFAENPDEAGKFFENKILSQWNEPTYAGLWINQLYGHYSEPGRIFNAVCHSRAGTLELYMNIYQQLIFFGFTLGLIALLRRREILAAVYPLVILGGVIYHTLFEAKSQYIIGYFILMIPIAAYGFAKAIDFAEKKKQAQVK